MRIPSTDVWGPRFVLIILLIWGAAFATGFTWALTVLTALGFASAMVGLRWPFLGLVGVGILGSLDSLTRVYLMTGGLLRWNTLNYWLLAVALLGAPILIRRNDPHSRLLGTFVLLLVLQLAISPDVKAGMLHILRFVTLFGMLVYFARAANDESAWYWLAITIGTLAGTGMLVYYLQRSSLPTSNNAGLATVPLTACFCICLGLRFAAVHRGGQLTLALLALVNYWWVFLSASRGSIFLATFCMCVLIKQINGVSHRIVLCVCAALLGIVVATQFANLGTTTLNHLGKLFDSDLAHAKRTSGRSDLLVGGWRLFLDNPIGVGTGGFAAEFSRLDNKEGLSQRMQGKHVTAHTLWVKTLAENGILGFVLLTVYIFSFILVGWKKRHQGLCTIGLLVSGCLSISFITNDVFGHGISMLAAGASVLLHRPDISQ